jgi:hypothetical protein
MLAAATLAALKDFCLRRLQPLANGRASARLSCALFQELPLPRALAFSS